MEWSEGGENGGVLLVVCQAARAQRIMLEHSLNPPRVFSQEGRHTSATVRSQLTNQRDVIMSTLLSLTGAEHDQFNRLIWRQLRLAWNCHTPRCHELNKFLAHHKFPRLRHFGHIATLLQSLSPPGISWVDLRRFMRFKCEAHFSEIQTEIKRLRRRQARICLFLQEPDVPPHRRLAHTQTLSELHRKISVQEARLCAVIRIQAAIPSK